MIDVGAVTPLEAAPTNAQRSPQTRLKSDTRPVESAEPSAGLRNSFYSPERAVAEILARSASEFEKLLDQKVEGTAAGAMSGLTAGMAATRHIDVYA